jgi:hypothetical protein
MNTVTVTRANPTAIQAQAEREYPTNAAGS